MKERQAAKLLRKRQLAELRDKAGSRATGEEKRKVERDKEAEERKRWEGEELVRMRHEEAAQLSGGDRWGSRFRGKSDFVDCGTGCALSNLT